MSETTDQQALFDLLACAEGRYPILARVFHVPGEANGGGQKIRRPYQKQDGTTGWKATPIEALRNAQLGYRKGIPDIIAPFRNRVAIWGYRPNLFTGLTIELKTARGVVSPEQESWQEFLISEGWACQVEREWTRAAALILTWAGADPGEWGV